VSKMEFNDLQSKTVLLRETLTKLDHKVQESMSKSSTLHPKATDGPLVFRSLKNPGQFFTALGGLATIALEFGIISTVAASIGCRLVFFGQRTDPTSWKAWGYGLLGVVVATAVRHAF
jgi:hypothetical protein